MELFAFDAERLVTDTVFQHEPFALLPDLMLVASASRVLGRLELIGLGY